MTKVNNTSGVNAAAMFQTGLDKAAERRDKAVQGATTFGIGPIRLPRGPFSNDKAANRAYDVYQQIQESLRNSFEMLKDAMVMEAGRR